MKNYLVALALFGVLLFGGVNITSTDIDPSPVATEDTRQMPQVYEKEFNIEDSACTNEVTPDITDKELSEYELSVLQYLHDRMARDEMTSEDEAQLLDLKEAYGDKVDEAFKTMDEEDAAFVIQTEIERKKAEIEQQKAEREESIRDLISYSSDESLNASLEECISKAPDSILNAVINMGYHIELVPDPGKGYGYRYICGLTVTDEHKILIQSRENKFRKAVIHEMSHVFDESLDWISKTEDFQKIFESEINSFRVHDYQSKHYKDNPQEYFAEACQEYVYHPTELKENAPKTYKFIKNLV